MTPKLGRYVPVGMCYYNDDFLPREYRDCLFVARWGNGTVPFYPLQKAGDAFKTDEQPFLVPQDEGPGRPLNIISGRGGRLFVITCDMEHNEESPVYHSRLFMVTKRDDVRDAPFAAFDETQATLDALFRELESPSWDQRYRAHIELTRRGSEAFHAAAQRLNSFDPQSPAACHLIWLAAAAEDAGTRAKLIRLTENGTPAIRLSAIRALTRFGAGDVGDVFAAALGDADPQVRHAALIGEFDRGGTLQFERVAALAASTLNEITNEAQTAHWEDGTYVRQMAAMLLARRASVRQLAALCESADPRRRMVGTLAAGFRLTLPPTGQPLSKFIPTGSMLADATNKFARPSRPDDLPQAAAGAFFSTKSMWEALTMTEDEENILALLERRLLDTNKNVLKQALLFLRLMRKRGLEEDMAAQSGLASHFWPRRPPPRSQPASSTHFPPAFQNFDWTKEAEKGKVSRGRDLFLSRGCNRCHSIQAGDGGSGGPSLAGAGSRFNIPYLAESVMVPNTVVLPLYRWTSLKLKSGEEVDGLLTAETGESVELLLPSATRRTVSKEEIVSRQLQNHSPMPEGLITTPGELRDLLSFLKNLRQ